MSATAEQPAITTHQTSAIGAFVACVVADLNPALRAINTPVNGDTEYELIVNGRGLTGVQHDEIGQVLDIATTYKGRAFVHHSEKAGEGCLCIVWGDS